MIRVFALVIMPALAVMPLTVSVFGITGLLYILSKARVARGLSARPGLELAGRAP